MKGVLSYILLVLSFYVYIYRPGFIAYPQLFTQLICVIILVGICLKWQKVNRYIYLFRWELLASILLLFYSILRYILGGENYQVSINLCLMTELIFGPVLLVACVKRQKIVRGILLVSMIASFISFLSLVFPQFKELLFSYFSYDDKLLIYVWRGFGLSNDLLYTYSVAQASIFCFLLETKNRVLIILGFIPFSVAVLFNARIGLLPIALYFIYKVIVERRLSILLYLLALIIVLVVVIVYSGIYDEYESTFSWLLDAFAETSNVVLGTSFDVQSSNIEILQNMIVYPSDLGEWIFGKGESIFGISGQNSDIGYIIQLNYGGIIYCILLAFFFFLIVYRLFKMGIKKEWYFFVVPILILLLNYKGDVFQSSSFMRVFMVIYLLTIIQYEKEKNNCNASIPTQ